MGARPHYFGAWWIVLWAFTHRKERDLPEEAGGPSRTMKRNNTVATTHMAADAHVNRLLGLLSSKDYRRLQPYLRHVQLGSGSRLPRAPASRFVYFIESGVGSLVNTMARRGRRGRHHRQRGHGRAAAAAGRRSRAHQCLCPGARRRPAHDRRASERQAGESASMRTVMLRYAHALSIRSRSRRRATISIP